MKHTKGEWGYSDSLLKSDGFLEIFSSFDEDGISPIADVHADNEGIIRSPEEAIANAKVISATPNLLEACEEVLNDWFSYDEHFSEKEPIYLEKVRNAINKAKGV